MFAFVRTVRRVIVLFLFVPALASPGAQKKPVRQDTHEIWNTIGGSSLSPDGVWLAHKHSPVVGNGAIVVRNAKLSTEWKKLVP